MIFLQDTVLTSYQKEPYAMPDLESEAAQRGIRSAKGNDVLCLPFSSTQTTTSHQTEAALELEFEGQVQTVKLSSTPFYYSFPSTQAHEVRTSASYNDSDN